MNFHTLALRSFLALVAVIFAAAPSLAQSDFWVDPVHGSDAAAGTTETSPWQTLKRRTQPSATVAVQGSRPAEPTIFRLRNFTSFDAGSKATMDPALIGTSTAFQALPRSANSPSGGAFTNPILVSIVSP